MGCWMQWQRCTRWAIASKRMIQGIALHSVSALRSRYLLRRCRPGHGHRPMFLRGRVTSRRLCRRSRAISAGWTRLSSALWAALSRVGAAAPGSRSATLAPTSHHSLLVAGATRSCLLLPNGPTLLDFRLWYRNLSAGSNRGFLYFLGFPTVSNRRP